MKKKDTSLDVRAAMGRFNGLVAVGKHEEAEAEAAKIEKEFKDDKNAMLSLAGYFFNRGLEDKAHVFYEHVLRIDPKEVFVRHRVARMCIKRNDLSKARDLLSFMTQKGLQQNSATLFSLAEAYQQKQDHYRALEYFRIIARDFPKVARSNGEFRRAVKQSENYTGNPETILPKREFIPKERRLPIALGALGVILIIIIAYSILNPRQIIHLVNRMYVPAAVTFPEKEAITVAPGERRVARASFGQYDVNVQLEGGKFENVRVNIPKGENKLHILNVYGGAVISWEKITYSSTTDPNAENLFELYTGDRFFSLDIPDYLFLPFPDEITLPYGNSTTKTRVGVLEYSPEEIINIILLSKLPQSKMMDYMETHLPHYPDSETILTVYAGLAFAGTNWQRAHDFLKQYLDYRPVKIEWHRFYQSLYQGSGKEAEIRKIYDSLLAKEPKNAGLLYLRGRIENDPKQAFQYYDRAIETDPKNPYAYFAKAYHLSSRGDLKGAGKLCAVACELMPSSYRMEEYFYLLRLGLKEYDILAKELSEKLLEQPEHWTYFTRLLQVRLAGNNRKGAQELLTRYIRVLRANDPTDYNQDQLLSRIHFNYYIGNFKLMQEGARKLKTEAAKNYYFQIAYFNKGKLNEVEALLKAQQNTSYDMALLLYSGWMKKGNHKRASHWLEQAIGKIENVKFPDNQIARWLEKPGGNILDQLDDLDSGIDTKRLLYTVFAQRYPPLRKQLLKRARVLNITREFPYHFLTGIHEAMK